MATSTHFAATRPIQRSHHPWNSRMPDALLCIADPSRHYIAAAINGSCVSTMSGAPTTALANPEQRSTSRSIHRRIWPSIFNNEKR
jgi:hypothetical protein